MVIQVFVTIPPGPIERKHPFDVWVFVLGLDGERAFAGMLSV